MELWIELEGKTKYLFGKPKMNMFILINSHIFQNIFDFLQTEQKVKIFYDILYNHENI